jgi:hypothetical protein
MSCRISVIRRPTVERGVAQEGLTGAACQRHRGILGELTKRNVKLSFGGSIHNPTDLQRVVVQRIGDGG